MLLFYIVVKCVNFCVIFLMRVPLLELRLLDISKEINCRVSAKLWFIYRIKYFV